MFPYKTLIPHCGQLYPGGYKTEQFRIYTNIRNPSSEKLTWIIKSEINEVLW